jgi:hypothetical protein
VFLRWARPPTTRAAHSNGAFFAGAGLALLDTILRENPPFAGALRAATACAKMAWLREDAAGLRDAEHLAPGVGTTQTSFAGRIHRRRSAASSS